MISTRLIFDYFPNKSFFLPSQFRYKFWYSWLEFFTIIIPSISNLYLKEIVCNPFDILHIFSYIRCRSSVKSLSVVWTSFGSFLSIILLYFHDSFIIQLKTESFELRHFKRHFFNIRPIATRFIELCSPKLHSLTTSTYCCWTKSSEIQNFDKFHILSTLFNSPLNQKTKKISNQSLCVVWQFLILFSAHFTF